MKAFCAGPASRWPRSRCRKQTPGAVCEGWRFFFFLLFYFFFFGPFSFWLCVCVWGDLRISMGKPLFSQENLHFLYIFITNLYISGSSPSSCPIYTVYTMYSICSIYSINSICSICCIYSKYIYIYIYLFIYLYEPDTFRVYLPTVVYLQY